jgi:methionine synthase I (cobalamin-dependent)/5,10-methylenetetrahydrofolate reductase
MLPFADRLKKGVLGIDGAMGTVLQDMGLHPPFDMACLTHPEQVVEVHKRYIDAGAEIIETASYSSNRVKLSMTGYEEYLEELNRRSMELAREAAGERVYVFASMGPVGRPLAPVGSIPDDVAEAAFREQASALLKNPPDGFILETFYDMHEFRIAVRVVKEMTDLPIIACKTFIEDGDTLAQGLPERVAAEMQEWDVAVIGTNCTVGPQRMLDIVRQMVEVSRLPIIAMPTPGLPQLARGRILYDTTPEYFAKNCLRLVEAGATIIGGCCGVTPDHIRAVSALVKGVKPGSRPVVGKTKERAVPAEILELDRSQFGMNLGRKFQIAVELDLPRGLDMTKVLTGAAALKEKGVSIIDISDGARARLRMNPVAVARLIQEQCGIEVMMHFSCRDRNLLAIQADLLGARALGINNILAVTGDPASIGDYPTATSVFDIDSIGLVRVLKRLNEGVDMAGNSIGVRTNFTIAVAFDPRSQNLEAEVDRLKRKAEAGAHVVYTQPLFDVETVRYAVAVCGEVGLPLMVGVLPLRSTRHAEFMHNEVPGIHIPDWIRKQMEDAEPDQAADLGIALARNLVAEIHPFTQGLYLMPPFGNHRVAEAVIEVIQDKMKS